MVYLYISDCVYLYYYIIVTYYNTTAMNHVDTDWRAEDVIYKWIPNSCGMYRMNITQGHSPNRWKILAAFYIIVSNDQ